MTKYWAFGAWPGAGRGWPSIVKLDDSGSPVSGRTLTAPAAVTLGNDATRSVSDVKNADHTGPSRCGSNDPGIGSETLALSACPGWNPGSTCCSLTKLAP